MTALNAERWAFLAARVDALLALAPEARARELDRLALDDADTAAQLRDLLTVRDDASRAAFLTGVADASWLPPTVAAGDALGAWTLVAPIGEGGMGTVWRARRNDGHYEGESAIKLLRTGLFDTATRDRFRQEGAILARLRHPGIAQLLDAGVTPQGQPYLVLELVSGAPIDVHCRAHALDTPSRVALYLQVLDAVAAAHAQLVIHRDLKPSNILVDEAGRVKLLDFGIARLAGEEDAPRLTRVGGLALTPEYAAPEQIDGGAIGTGADVFALGIVLYELLAGVHPSGLAQAVPMAYLRAANEGAYRLASDRADSAGLRHALRGDLDQILAKALRREPAQRYATVTAFADDLLRHLRREPVAARAPTWRYQAGRFVQRHRAGSVLAALGVAAIAAGMAGTGVQGHRAEVEAATARAERARAVEAAVESDHQRALAQGEQAAAQRATDRANDAASAADDAAAIARTERGRAQAQTRAAIAQRDLALHEMARARDFRYLTSIMAGALPAGQQFTTLDVLRRSAEAVEAQADRPPQGRATLLAVIAETMAAMGETAKARAVLERAHALAWTSDDREVRAEVSCRLGATLARVRRVDEARRFIDEGLGQLPDEPRYVARRIACLQQASDAEASAGDAVRAVALAEQAQRLEAALPLPDPMLAGETLGRLAEALRVAGRYPEALAAGERALAAGRALGLGQSTVARAQLDQVGTLLLAVGRPKEAEAMLGQAIGLSQGEARDAPAVDAMHYASALLALGQAARAEAITARAQARADASGNTPAANALRWTRVGILRELGRVEEAARLLDDVEARYGAAGAAVASASASASASVDAALRAQMQIERGRLAQARGQVDEARRWLDQGVAGLRASAGTTLLLLHGALLRRAEVRQAQGDAEGARADAAEAMALLAQRLGANAMSSDRGDAWMVIGLAQAPSPSPSRSREAFAAAAAQYAATLGPEHEKTQRARRLAGLP
jgi:serine/threonine-protein kinase